MQKTKAKVKICNKDYTVVSNETPEYMHEIGVYVDKKMREFLQSSVSLTDSMAAVLTAINVTDEMFKAKQTVENMRTQIGRYIEDSSKSKHEADILREENENLKEQIKLLKRG